MKRLVATVLLAALAVSLTGCEGGRYRLRLIIDASSPIPPDPQLNSGTISMNGEFYDVWCDLNGAVTLIVPHHAAGREIPVRGLDDVGPIGTAGGTPLPENALTFDFAGDSYAVMGLPDELLDEDFAGSAADLIDAYGVQIDGQMASTTLQWDYDTATGIADVRFAATSEIGRPDPFAYDSRYETIVVHGANEDDPDFVYQRIVGPLDQVVSYLEDLGGNDLTDRVSEMLLGMLSTSD